MLNAYYETKSRVTKYIPGAFALKGVKGTRLVATTRPDPELNMVAVGHGRDLREVEAFAEELSATSVPWSFQVRGDVDPELKELAVRYGKTCTNTYPLLLWDAGSLPALPAALPDGAAVRKISGDDSEAFAAALAAGFQAPKDIARLTCLPAFLDDPGVTGFVLDLNGETVAIGINVLAGHYAGMYSGSVPPRHRGNGYYRALVSARLADAVACGARYAFSTNTPMSRPLFESLGFRLAATLTHLNPAP